MVPFFGNLGETAEGDPLYTLGRMAFDMFLPTQLVVSLQGNFNPVHVVPDEERQHTLENKVPKSLVDEVLMGNHVLRTYKYVSFWNVDCVACHPPIQQRMDYTVEFRQLKGDGTCLTQILHQCSLSPANRPC